MNKTAAYGTVRGVLTNLKTKFQQSSPNWTWFKTYAKAWWFLRVRPSELTLYRWWTGVFEVPKRSKNDPSRMSGQSILQQIEFMMTMGGSLNIRRKKRGRKWCPRSATRTLVWCKPFPQPYQVRGEWVQSVTHIVQERQRFGGIGKETRSQRISFNVVVGNVLMSLENWKFLNIGEVDMVSRSNFLFFQWTDKSGNVWRSVQPRRSAYNWVQNMRLEGFKVKRVK